MLHRTFLTELRALRAQRTQELATEVAAFEATYAAFERSNLAMLSVLDDRTSAAQDQRIEMIFQQLSQLN
jgi:uncharacterized protein YlxW (UPF0749 family)